MGHELKAAYGLGGRARRAGDHAERARSAVTWRIRSAIARIDAVHPALGRHLKKSGSRTGTFCAYTPEQRVDWRLTPLTASSRLRRNSRAGGFNPVINLPCVDGGRGGVPVVMLHGVTDSWRSFEPVLPHLPDDIRAIAVTLRGHGDAPKPESG